MRLKSVVRKSLYGGFLKQSAGKLISAMISLFRNGMLMFVVLVSTNGWGKDSPPPTNSPEFSLEFPTVLLSAARLQMPEINILIDKHGEDVLFSITLKME